MTSFVTSPHCSVKNMEVGEEYDFRISAENEYGVSEPLQTTEPVLAKYPFGKRNVEFRLELKRNIVQVYIDMLWKLLGNKIFNSCNMF